MLPIRAWICSPFTGSMWTLISKKGLKNGTETGPTTPLPAPTGEEGILLIKALCGLGRLVSNVNIPNTAGQIPNLPREAVVETNALFERDAIRPIQAGALPEAVRALVMPHVENHERILKAALTGDRALVLEAFMADPLVKGKGCTKEQVKALIDGMLEGTRAYLPKMWF